MLSHDAVSGSFLPTETILKILILGAGGMLGHSLFKYIKFNTDHDIYGTVRRLLPVRAYYASMANRLSENIDASDPDSIRELLLGLRPDVIINCIGIIKQLEQAEDPIACISINALFPHLLARQAAEIGARVIHISTDCVFDGLCGGYREADHPNATDLYGKTKLLGELAAYAHAITIRTSIIGHELNKCLSLIDWFLSQQGQINGYRRAIYSGLPTAELAEVIARHVLPRPELQGLYHVTSDPISKFELLRLVAKAYGKIIDIHPVDDLVIDRSMDSSRFRSATGYHPPAWERLVEKMHSDYLQHHRPVRETAPGA